MSRLEEAIAAGRFLVTAELLTIDAGGFEGVRERFEPYEDWVDAVNATDNTAAHAHASPLAVAIALKQLGMEPVMQLVCRDRNRLAITADLLGAWALGARNVLVLGGDPLTVGDHPDAKPVFDLETNGVVSLARRIRDEGRTLAGVEVADPPSFLIGVADVPLADRYDPAKLEAKLDAGAGAVWTQIVYDVDRLGEWADLVRSRGVFERAKVIVGLVPLRSTKNARFLDGLFGVHVPSAAFDLLEAAGADAEAVGTAFTVEAVEKIRTIDGIAGVHLMGVGRDDLVRAVIEGSGLFPRPTSSST
jgi:methylenetetrahydrofolate reductase (NADPH)